MIFSEKTLKTFNASLERCQANPQFLNLFYQKFIIINPEIREKFSSTNMENQKMILHASLYMIMIACQGNDAAITYLNKIAATHSRIELDIKPELYDVWLTTLIETVAEIDAEFNIEIEKAWKDIMTFGIEFMKSRYDG